METTCTGDGLLRRSIYTHMSLEVALSWYQCQRTGRTTINPHRHEEAPCARQNRDPSARAIRDISSATRKRVVPSPTTTFAPNAMLVSARGGTVPRTDRWLSDRGVSPATRGGVGFRARTHGASAVFLSAGETKRSLPRSLHARARARTHQLTSVRPPKLPLPLPIPGVLGTVVPGPPIPPGPVPPSLRPAGRLRVLSHDESTAGPCT